MFGRSIRKRYDLTGFQSQVKYFINLLIFPLLIGTEGAKTPAGVRGRGDPTGALAPRRLPGTPAESEAPGVEINRPVRRENQ
jgi:hypothetical protein